MNQPNPAQLETAWRMLELEHASAGAGAPASTAAGRVYDKIQASLAPLIGEAGVRLLLVRAAQRANSGFSNLADSPIFERSAVLRERLNAQPPAVTPEAAAALFASFIALVTALIGERLTTEVLRTTWPSLHKLSPGKPTS